MDIRILKLAKNLKKKPPATEEAISELQRSIGSLPLDYLEFMRISNGCEGFVRKSFLQLWRIEDIPSLNVDYAVHEFAPGLVIFGSDGGDTAYAFDTRNQKVSIVQVPFIGMDLNEISNCAESFLEFLQYLRSLD